MEFKMKHKGWEIVLCIFTLVLSILSSTLGYAFMSGATDLFTAKFMYGLIFFASPLLVVQLLILLWKQGS